MAIRKIIEIDEDLCNGCGLCETGCAEGALRVIDGKAVVVKEQFCDGFGDCVGECPTGALKIIEREAEEFDIDAVKTHLRQTQGEEAVERMVQAMDRHEAVTEFDQEAPPAVPSFGGCPGSQMRELQVAAAAPAPTASDGAPAKVNQSELAQWPVQLHLVQPGMPFFQNKELVVLSTCAPVASADVHWRFLRGRSVVVACPKLDKTEPYTDKLAGILGDTTIPKVIIVRMQVPCCGGLTHTVAEAVARSGRTDLIVEETVVALDGSVLETRPIA